MINRMKGLLFVICIVLTCTAQSKRPEDREQRSEQSGRPASYAPVAPRVPNVHNNQASPRVESTRTPQVIRREAAQREAPQTHIAQPAHQARIEPRVHAVSSPSPVENKQFLHRQHHNYWHPHYNFYEHQYHFYPYVSVASTVELSPNCSQILFEGQTYYYDYWTFYLQVAGGYLAVPPPIGIIVCNISSHATQVIISGEVYYNYNNVYYKPVPQGFQVVEPLN